MSGLIFSSRIFFAPQGMESTSHPFKPWAGLCVCVCVCVCSAAAATAAKSLQSCPTLCDPIDGIQFFVTPWIIAHQAALSMGFSRQEYWPG